MPSRCWRSGGSLFVGIRALLARPRTREVVPAHGAVAVHDDPRGLEDHPLQRRRSEDLAPWRLLRRALRRVLVVDLRPDEIEDLLADETGQDSEDEPDWLIEQLHVRTDCTRSIRRRSGKHDGHRSRSLGEGGPPWTSTRPTSCSAER